MFSIRTDFNHSKAMTVRSQPFLFIGKSATQREADFSFGFYQVTQYDYIAAEEVVNGASNRSARGKL